MHTYSFKYALSLWLSLNIYTYVKHGVGCKPSSSQRQRMNCRFWTSMHIMIYIPKKKKASRENGKKTSELAVHLWCVSLMSYGVVCMRLVSVGLHLAAWNLSRGVSSGKFSLRVCWHHISRCPWTWVPARDAVIEHSPWVLRTKWWGSTSACKQSPWWHSGVMLCTMITSKDF